MDMQKWQKGRRQNGIKDITGIRLFVTSDDIGNESNTLSFEDIAIVADGVTGPDGQITEEEKVEIENAVRDAVLTTTQNNLDTAKKELSNDITAANKALDNPGQNSPFRGRLDRMSSWR